MWPFTTNKEKQFEKRTITTISRLVFINNHTDKEYIFESNGPYGLGWEHSSNGAILYLNQYLNAYSYDRPRQYERLAILRDFSLLKIEEKEFVITVEKID